LQKFSNISGINNHIFLIRKKCGDVISECEEQYHHAAHESILKYPVRQTDFSARSV